ncbi:MAG: hypothetical protein A2020_15250 [Lentisphaerae bacterium GWF2_45_14]|nr:MAG: hypothetical protein A2020_15250 [Lentisphaerae bacterium GWF2_45_14]
MKISIISIGDELLKGSTINTNLAHIGQKLFESGILPINSLTIPDSEKEMRDAFDFAFSLCDVVITTGGLGPTADDVSKDIAASYFGRGFYEDEDSKANIIERWNKLNRKDFPARLLQQAKIPEGAEPIKNITGTAPGIWLESEDPDGKPRLLIMLPGPPSELRPMFDDIVMPRLRKRIENPLKSKLFFVAGMAESIVEEKMQPLLCPELSVAYCASPGNVRLFLSSADNALLRKKIEGVQKIFKKHLLPENCSLPVEHIIGLLRTKNLRLATAESCTGGLIASEITSVSGASDVFTGSVISYANKVKTDVLGVAPETIENFGAVSAECASEMVSGVCEKLAADAGIAVTGIAGPGGGTKEKPVGLVFIAVKFYGELVVKRYNFSGTREAIRIRALSMSINMLRELILGMN